MKKLLCVLLAILIAFSSLPLITASDNNIVHIELMPYETVVSYMSVIDFGYTVEGAESDPYIHLTSKPGSYNNNDYYLSFKASSLGINMLDYPIIKLGYRTDSPYGMLNASIKSDAGENYPNPHTAHITDGQWHDIVLDMNTFNSQADTFPTYEQGTSINLIFKPLGSGNKTLTKEYYYDLKYIAFFKTKAEADAYTYSYNQNEDSGVGKLVKYAPLTASVENAIVSGADDLIEEILNTPNNSYTPTGNGNTYYVSEELGKSYNSGTSESSPITMERLKSLLSESAIPEGSVILFRRGEIFRANGTIKLTASGLTLSSYGEGEKPRIYNSIAGEGKSNWVRTSDMHVWKYIGRTFTKNQDVGNIVFNNGEGWGIKVSKKNKTENIRVDIGLVYNGYESFMSGGDPADATGNSFSPYRHSTPFIDQRDLSNNLEFYHNWDDNTLYLYYDKGNPGKLFDSIEIAAFSNLLYVGSGQSKNVTIDNIAFAHSASHGIGAQYAKNFTVKNCTFAWIGGALQFPDNYETGDSGKTRLGNAVENWGSCSDYTIDHCYATQIYDCCFTTQFSIGYSDSITSSNSNIAMSNITFTNTVSTYSNSGPEVWLTNMSQNATSDNCNWSIKNLEATNNYVLYGGYGWGHQRYNKDSNFFYGAVQNDLVTVYENCNYYGNYFFKARHTGIKARYAKEAGRQNSGYDFRDNTFVMAEGLTILQTGNNLTDCSGSNTHYKYDQATITTLVANDFFPECDFYYYDIADAGLPTPEKEYPYDPNYDSTVIVSEMLAAEELLKYADKISFTGLGYSDTFITDEDDVNYFRINAVPGNYSDNGCLLRIPLEALEYKVNVKSNPYIKIAYRTNISNTNAPALDYVAQYPIKSFFSTTNYDATITGPTLAKVNDGSRQNAVINIASTSAGGTYTSTSWSGSTSIKTISDFNFSTITDTSNYKELILKPWGAGEVSPLDGEYFDIVYIAFFPDAESAEKFEYPIMDNTVFGDVNGDEIVDSNDSVVLARFLAKWTGYTEINEDNSNLNQDTVVDSSDSVILARYLAKWSGYEVLPIG
ncbi:MAG: dockerin type I repeat-containing protein [Clostridia bacterium]|nr:dockerin type I repeat-containing protein [Clostridia bacterium]